VSAERITKELTKMAELSGAGFAYGLELLDETGLLKWVMPEIDEMKKFDHSPHHHPEGGVYEHTRACLKQNPKTGDAKTNFSILFHDVGKIKTHEFVDGIHKYHGHDCEGVKIIAEIAERMKLDNDTRDAIGFCAENHMKFHKFEDLKTNTIIKMMDSPWFQILYDVARFDSFSKCVDGVDCGDRYRNWEKIDQMMVGLRERFKTGKIVEKIKGVVNGAWVMELTGLKPGKVLGDLMKETVSWIMDNGVDLNDLEAIKRHIQESKK
jgi:hypothetical protein